MSSINDISSTPSVVAEANKNGDESIICDENIPLEVLYSDPTEVAAPTIQQDANDRYDLSTLSETNDECCSESFAGACSTDNIFQQIGHSFSNIVFGCNSRTSSPRGKRDLKDKDETYAHRTNAEGTTIGTITTDGSIECPSPCCSPTKLASPSSMSMVAHPSLSSYQRGKSSNKIRVASNEESWDHAFRKGSFTSRNSTSVFKTNSRPSKTQKNGTAANKSSHHSTPKRGGKASIRSARTIPSKRTAQTSSEPSISDSSFHFHRSTMSQGGSTSRSKRNLAVPSSPTTLQLSPMSSLSRSSTASSSRASKSRAATSSRSDKNARPSGPHVPQVQMATPLHHVVYSNQVNTDRGLGMVTGKKRISLPPGYLHNFELTDDPTSFSSGPVVSWCAPSSNSSQGAVCIGDHVVKVGGKDTRRMSALDVSRLLHTKRHKERVVTLSFRSFH